MMKSIAELPEFDRSRLLKEAGEALASNGVAERDVGAVQAARAAVERALSGGDGATMLELRSAARGLLTVANKDAQRAMLSMLAAADMSEPA